MEEVEGPRLGGYLAPPVMLARFECIFLNEKTSELGGSVVSAAEVPQTLLSRDVFQMNHV